MLPVISKKNLKWSIVSLFLILLAVLYGVYHPSDHSYFPKCPFREITGYLCPGCGSQRAIHYLLNGDVMSAIKENGLLVLSIPYVLMGFTIDAVKHPSVLVLKWRKRLFGQTAIFIVLGIVIGFWILRNTGYFPISYN